jgi:twitching motility protein PilT
MPVIDQLFHTLIEMGGSDLHLSEGQPPKVRVHGGIHPIGQDILTRETMGTMMQEICTP